MSKLDEIYRSTAIESLTSRTSRYAPDAEVKVVPGGAWVSCETFIPTEWLAAGHRLEPRVIWADSQHPQVVAGHDQTPGDYVLTLGETDFAFSDDPMSLVKLIFPNF